ncbi:MAG: hypothetical protein IPP69_14660 [Flavobacteriales bacterium]|nr:hypothetical protein [Flavobacteriales bacterium]
MENTAPPMIHRIGFLKIIVISFLIGLTIQSCDTAGKSENPTHQVDQNSEQINTINCYTRAIEEYIKWTNAQNSETTDTIFIGRHDDFPDIELPVIIEDKKICLIPFEDSFQLLRSKHHITYLNIVGTVTPTSSEFLFVTFHEGGKPQHNCTVKLIHPDGSEKIRLESLMVDSAYTKPREVR